jgi:hypothetical protein
MIINLLNRGASTATLVDAAYYDTSGDGEASPLDALLVINALNVRSSSPAEGEASVVTPLQISDFAIDLLRRKVCARLYC